MLVAASNVPLHPSTVLLRAHIASLRFLLPTAPARPLPVLLVHDQLAAGAHRAATTSKGKVQQLILRGRARQYDQYLQDVAAFVAASQRHYGQLRLKLLIAPRPSRLAGVIAFGLTFVTTPLVLKTEHDIIFVRPIPLSAIMADMLSEDRLVYVRFAQRRTAVECGVRPRVVKDDPNATRGHSCAPELVACPHPRTQYARATRCRMCVAAPPLPLDGRRRLRQQYTPTTCWSDMNHLARSSFYRDEVIPLTWHPERVPTRLQPSETRPERAPETYMQWAFANLVDKGHAPYLIHGGREALPSILHLDGKNAVATIEATANGNYSRVCAPTLVVSKADLLAMHHVPTERHHERMADDWPRVKYICACFGAESGRFAAFRLARSKFTPQGQPCGGALR